MKLHVDEDISSLSAILLDDEYYRFLKQGIIVSSDVPILDVEHLIPFKIKAFLDLSQRAINGEAVDLKNIKKHKNDVFRLSELLYERKTINISATIASDILNFIDIMKREYINLKQLGIKKSKDDVLAKLLRTYTE